MGWLIALGVLALLAVLPLGISGIYDQNGPAAKLLIGPVSISLYPAKNGREKKEKQEKRADDKTKKAAAQQAQQKKGGALSELLPLIGIAVDFLGDLRRKLRVKRLELLLVMAGDDPCDLAVNYGRAWAAVGNIMPQLERLFVIKKRNVNVACDFVETRTTVYVHLDITITLGRLLVLLTRYGFRALRVVLNNTENKKGGAVK